MGRTNLIIVVIGFGACLVLSFVMQRLLVYQDENKSDVVAKEVNDKYGSRLTAQAVFKINGAKKKGQRKAVLSIVPQIPSAGPRLARTIGVEVWRRHGDKFDHLSVLVRRHKEDIGRSFEINRPLTAGRPTEQKRVPRPKPKTARKTRVHSRPTSPR